MNSGVYFIYNIINDKFYVGSSFDLNKRISTHVRELTKGIHHSIYLQRSWDKYTYKNFVCVIVELCPKDKCKELEQYYLDLYKPEYNVCKDAIAVMGGRKHKPETLEKFKLRKPSIGSLGQKWSKETRENNLKARKLRDYKHSTETKEKMRQTSIKLNRASSLVNSIEKQKKKIKDSKDNIFNSLVEAAKFWEMSVQSVCDILKGRTNKSKKGIKFFYV